jgi:hypothetical protein
MQKQSGNFISPTKSYRDGKPHVILKKAVLLSHFVKQKGAGGAKGAEETQKEQRESMYIFSSTS